jgi:hypothetical protein
MYTFGILVAFLLILSGAIFGKNIKQNQFPVAFIVFAGTMIGSIIVNGIVGMDIPYTLTTVKTKNLNVQVSKVFTLSDTLLYRSTYLQYIYKMELKKNGDTIITHYTDVGASYDLFYPKGEKHREIVVDFLPEGDSIPYLEIKRYKRFPDNRWISPVGLPGGGRVFYVYLPNDSIHNVLMDQLNDKFFTKDEEQIAKLN